MCSSSLSFLVSAAVVLAGGVEEASGAMAP